MNKSRIIFSLSGFIVALGSVMTMSGCQTTVGGQTLPSAYYLDDDVQYFPAYSDDLLPKLKQSLDEYRVEQSATQQ
jgi:hypothetical protein